jgi:hypothetical protein
MRRVKNSSQILVSGFAPMNAECRLNQKQEAQILLKYVGNIFTCRAHKVFLTYLTRNKSRFLDKEKQ